MSGGPRAAAKGFRSKPYAESAWLWGEWMSGGPRAAAKGGALGGVEVAQEFVKEKYSGVTLA